ncbi:anthranilate phosphoribosyltransferase [Chthonomonas calidirosea]|uniref:anthranilate phosphoribosyltransferase n=1 Tax=Chthonomonas calidirosea TaxID=454171 RepID=UPI0006DD42F1|nr:anthranilate phosphoribosyltransferase [Chthonomonas calidirosea]CEK15760.1 anthranilate phosphoribosyltransferase [Chthonomonas calidirosea]
MLKQILNELVLGKNLTREQAAQLMQLLMEGEATPAQIGGLLVALRMKGETVEEITGFAQAMRTRLQPVHPQSTPLLDTCGTGGGRFRVFNVSTAVAFVLAAAGTYVAKHGNRAVSGTCGSADVLEALGARIDLSPEQCARCIDEVGVGFLFAPLHHPALRHVGGPRRELGIRTVFNLLGPLVNPAGATLRLMGIYDESLCRTAAEALHALGTTSAIVAHGHIGVGEIATVGTTLIAELREGHVDTYTLTRRDFGLPSQEPRLEDLMPEATPEANAALLRRVFTPQHDDTGTRAKRELVAVNAAAALRVCGYVEDWKDAYQMAQDLIASCKPLETLERFVAFTRKF